MELAGNITDNLTAALTSARRLRGHPVYADTLEHWHNVVTAGRRSLQYTATQNPEQIRSLIVALEGELSER